MANKAKDITNRKFGKLTAVKCLGRFNKGKKYHYFWEFRCDCGNTKISPKNYVVQGNTRSCGCMVEENYFRKPEGIANRTRVFYIYKTAAKKRELSFKLTKEEFYNIIDKNCYYCNSAPSNVSKTYNGNGDYIYNGVDRIDNSIGYVLTNCVPCCKICNRAKNNMEEKAFCDWVIKIYQNYHERALLDIC